ncbi:hypothetical protein F7R02_23170 [Xanthomonas cissicola]|nr:hypothetical protein F7R02_23170 [Xanthomonas cissicola]
MWFGATVQKLRIRLIHHSDRGVQYVSIRYTERLAEGGRSAPRKPLIRMPRGADPHWPGHWSLLLPQLDSFARVHLREAIVLVTPSPCRR